MTVENRIGYNFSLEIRRHLPGEVIHCLLEKNISDKFYFLSLLSLSRESVLTYIFVMVY